MTYIQLKGIFLANNLAGWIYILGMIFGLLVPGRDIHARGAVGASLPSSDRHITCNIMLPQLATRNPDFTSEIKSFHRDPCAPAI